MGKDLIKAYKVGKEGYFFLWENLEQTLTVQNKRLLTDNSYGFYFEDCKPLALSSLKAEEAIYSSEDKRAWKYVSINRACEDKCLIGSGMVVLDGEPDLMGSSGLLA